MFELNTSSRVKTEYVLGSPVYYIDDFYQNPDEVANYLFNRDVPLWKIDEKPNFNSVHFYDRRLITADDRVGSAYNFLASVCKSRYREKVINTNMIRFVKNDFNDYEHKYWWPHTDSGYNGIVYFNKDEENSGTNLYDPKVMDHPNWHKFSKYPEQYLCWTSKNNFDVVKSFKSVYNRAVLFDGSKFPHGMNIANDRFFGEEYRCNQVFFFKRA